LPNILFGFESLSLTLRKEQRLMVFKKRVLQIPGANREEVTRDWSKLHNKDHHNFYTSPNSIHGNQLKKNELGRTCNMYERKERCTKSFGGET